MYKKRIALVFLIGLCACAKPALTRRYADHQFSETLPEPTAHLTMFSMEAPQTSARTTLVNLSDKGQAAFIEALAAKTSKADELIASLGKAIKSAGKIAQTVDRTRFKRRIVFSLENQSLEPANRLSWARIRLELVSNAEFENWDKFVTNYESVDLGKLAFEQGFNFSLDDLTLKPPQIKELDTAKFKSGFSRNLKEELELKQRYVEATGTLTPKTAELLQEGVVGIDLTGNSLIDIEIQVKSLDDEIETLTFANLRDKSSKPNSQGEITISRQYNTISETAADVMGTITLDYMIREVTRGDESNAEGDDHVRFVKKKTTPETVVLIPARELRFSGWLIKDPSGRHLQLYSTRQQRAEDIYLSDYDNAEEFLAWLKETKATMLNGRSLYLAGDLLTRQDLAGLAVEIHQFN